MGGDAEGSAFVAGGDEPEQELGSGVVQRREAEFIDQDQVVAVTPTSVTVLDRNGDPVQPKELNVDFLRDRASKGNWATYMEKEIHEQPRSIFDTLAGRTDSDGHLTLDEVRISEDVLRRADKMIIVACGTAAYAGQVARYAIEHWCRIPVEVELAHEFRYRDPVVSEKTLVVAVSQSGETMDTIMAIRHARNQGAKVIAIVNTPGSTIARESDAVLLTHAGPEIGVASTKAFTTQLAALALLTLALSKINGHLSAEQEAGYLNQLRHLPVAVAKVLELEPEIEKWAQRFAGKHHALFLGRGSHWPIAMEGALKLKEISYIHAESYAAGELKHGPLALVDKDMPVIAVAPADELLEKLKSNLQEVRARGGELYVFADAGSEIPESEGVHILHMPEHYGMLSPILHVIPLQLLSYHAALVKGTDVDKPRNLAKSVTVE